MERRAIGLVELARIAGVSASTASRALSDNPVIAKDTRARIKALAREHGFRLNQTASAFRRRRSGAIGVVLPLGHEASQHLSDPFFMSLLGPLADTLTERGYDLLLSRVIPASARWLDPLIESGRVDGVVVIGQSNQIAEIERVATRYRPIVIWGSHHDQQQQTVVGTDNVAGGRLAADHVIARGRSQLAFLGNIEVPEFAQRYAGFRAAVAAAGGGVRGSLLPVHLTTEASYNAFGAFLKRNPPPDAIVAASDVIAMSAMRVLAEHAIAVPRDVSVIGYDDVMLAQYTNPPLTTIRQDVARGAQLLVDLLLRRIAGEETASIAMPPQLIVRGSA